MSAYVLWSKVTVHKVRPVVPGCAGCAMAHPDFGISLNLILTRGTDSAPPFQMSHQKFICGYISVINKKTPLCKGPSINNVSSEWEGGGPPSKPIYYISLFRLV